MRILYLSNLYASFVHDQILSILTRFEIKHYTNFHINLYTYLRNLKYNNLLNKKNLSQIVPNSRCVFYPGLPRNFLKLLYPLFLYAEIKLLYGNKKIDLIHAHTILPSGYVAYRLSKLKKVPFIVTTHGADFYRCSPEISKIRKIKQYSKIELRMVRTVLSNAESVICVSDKFAEDVKQFHPEANVKVVPNGYRSDLFSPQDQNICRKKLNLNTNLRILISVGNFVDVKGHKYLIDSFPSILRKNKNILLVLIGGGLLKQKYIEKCKNLQITKNVIILDKIPHNELSQWYNSADIFVLPSLNETFGIVILEAMACGLPVVATDTAGPTQIIQDKVNGLLIPSKNVNAISNTVNNLLSNNQLYDSIRNNAIESTKKYKNISTEIYELYKTAIMEN